ncbi:TRAP transporter small permease [Virgibacillus byunsanensis]|uniref:TRAP transporter small permease n=1 Tax=Virgibacillus byunsanensis TaxID=570945 RepID=A0ABW3LN66_9BACI
MKGVLSVYKYFDYIKIIGVWISGISLIGMMLFIVYDVFLRNIVENSINGGFEIVQNYFMPIVVFPSLAYVYSSGVLPKMDMLIERFKNKTKMFIIIGMVLIEIFVLILMTQFSLEYALNGLEREIAFPAAGTLYPLYPIFFFVPIAFGLIIVENIFILIRNLIEKQPSFLFKGEDKK